MTKRNPEELMGDFARLYRELRKMREEKVFKVDATLQEKNQMSEWLYEANELAHEIRETKDLDEDLFLQVNFTPVDMIMVYSELTYNRGRDTDMLKALIEAGDAMLEDTDADESGENRSDD